MRLEEALQCIAPPEMVVRFLSEKNVQFGPKPVGL
jgi:hypothetical protein